MTTASHIVDVLLETDEPSVNIEPDDVNPETYLYQYADQIDKDAREGKLTAQTALTASRFYSRLHTYKNGRSPIEVRRNGATKTWKTRPGEFRIPVKYGLYEYFYITDKDAADWSTIPLASNKKGVEGKTDAVNRIILRAPPLPPERI